MHWSMLTVALLDSRSSVCVTSDSLVGLQILSVGQFVDTLITLSSLSLFSLHYQFLRRLADRRMLGFTP